MTSLMDLALKYHCDKASRHSYIPFYERLLAGLKVHTLFEIGIGYRDLMVPFAGQDYIDGASLWMWQDYFPEAAILACDIRDDILINQGRIRSCQCDQSKAGDLLELVKWLPEYVDVIIDDGSHQTAHQVMTAHALLHVLSDHGVYVIEDVMEPDVLLKELNGVAHLFGKQVDDTLVVLRRED